MHKLVRQRQRREKQKTKNRIKIVKRNYFETGRNGV